MRTVIPLVRRLEPTETGPIELEFDVPALPDDDTPPVFVGVRVTGKDPTESTDVGNQLERADIAAELHLARLASSGPVAVTLMRSDWVSRSETQQTALPADGTSSGLFAFDADFSTLQAAGLLSERGSYQELAFAYTPELPAGRYRLTLDVIRNREALMEAKAELLVAYTAKGK